MEPRGVRGRGGDSQLIERAGRWRGSLIGIGAATFVDADDDTLVVLLTLSGAPRLLLLGPLLLFHFGRLPLDLTGTSQRAVHLTSGHRHRDIDSRRPEIGQSGVIFQRAAPRVQLNRRTGW